MTDLEIAVQLLGGSTNKVIYDNAGIPSIMVRFDKGNNSSVLTEGSETTHAAFRVNDVEIPCFWYSKYQNVVIDGQAYSLPLQDPETRLSFDDMCLSCTQKGAGWHMSTNAEWAWIALQAYKNGFVPRGNTLNGKNHGRADENGVVTSVDESNGSNARVATGSGPKSWAHNNDVSGVWDFVGNVYERVGGLRLVDGEIQILPYNNAADSNNPQNTNSTLWKAILQDGTLTTPGTANTLKYDYVNGTPPDGTGTYGFQVNTVLANPVVSDFGRGSRRFKDLATAKGVTVPEIMKCLALFPSNDMELSENYIYMTNHGIKLAYRGGAWFNGNTAGQFNLGLSTDVSFTAPYAGFRSAYIDLQ